LLQREYQITSCKIRNLFCFFFHNDCIAIWHSLFNIDLDLFRITDYSLCFTVRTFCSHCLSFTSAIRALRLHIHLHSKTHGDFLHDNSLPFTFLAFLRFAIFCARASTLGAVNISIDIHMMNSTIIHLLKSDRDCGSSVRPFLHSSLPSINYQKLKSFHE
jgi:hypothetical protein